MNKTFARILYFGFFPLWFCVVLLYDLLHKLECEKE